MTHPLTPREKVFVSASCDGEYCHCGSPAVRKVGEEIMHDDPRPRRHNLTAYVCARHFAEMMGPSGARSVGYPALASGSGDQLSGNPGILKSGDHAELARLARKAREQMTCEATTDALCDGVDALLAEIAALRSAKWEAKHADTMNDMVLMGMARDDAESRATEAERELAEAYRTVRQFVAATNGTTYPSNHPMWAALESAQQLLSKEAERE